MKFKSCTECGAKCCKFFSIPLSVYVSELDPDPERYFSLHENLRVVNTRYGKEIIVYSRCRELKEDNSCDIYGNHPELCKNFTKKTAHRYCVPHGCIYDEDDLFGEDFGV
jgi:Fe-S-cluster containining protein